VEIPEWVASDLDRFHLRSKIENRYTQPLTPISLELAYKYADQFRQMHPGFDCLITRTENLLGIISYIGDVFVGYPPVGNIMSMAARYVDSQCLIVRGLHGTFHVGSRNGNWNDSKVQRLLNMNGQIVQKNFQMNPHLTKATCASVHMKLSTKILNRCLP